MARSDTVQADSQTPPLRVGAALSRSFSFYGRNLPFLAALGIVVFLPLVLYQLDYTRSLTESPMWERSATGAYVLMLLYFLTPLVLQVFVSLAVFQHLAGERTRPLRSVSRGLASFLPAMGLALLFALILIGVVFAVGFPIGIFMSSARGSAVMGVIFTLVLVLALVWVHCVFFVAPQALVVERIMPWTALGRSRRLTRGARWRIFAIVLVIVALLWLLTLVMEAVRPDALTWSQQRLNILLSMGLVAVFAPFAAVCAAVVYHDLRRAREGVDVEELIRVFT